MFQTIGGEAMGGPWFAKLPQTWPAADAQQVVQGALDAVNAAMSPWRAQAEINRLGALPAGTAEVSEGVAQVLACALQLQLHSSGALRPTLGAEVSAMGSGPAGVAPTAPVQITLDGRQLYKSGPARFDLCATAKGYGVDQAAAGLRAMGVQDFLLNVSGEVYASGQGPKGLWQVALELPLADRQVIFRKLPLQGGLATSGTYLKDHLIDGRTGTPVAPGLMSVTVAHPSVMWADGWATALAVLGPDAGPTLARAHSLKAVFISAEEGGFREEMVGFG